MYGDILPDKEEIILLNFSTYRNYFVDAHLLNLEQT